MTRPFLPLLAFVPVFLLFLRAPQGDGAKAGREGSPPAAAPGAAKNPRSRSFEFLYEAEVKDPPEGAKRMEVWIPVPSTDAFQRIAGLSVDCPVAHEFTTEAEYGNRLLHATAEPARPFRIAMRFEAERLEQTAAPDAAREKLRGRLLRSDALVPVEGRAKEIAGALGPSAKTPREKARSVYDFVLSKMAYDKSGTGWGRGDFNYACEAGKGNCTDFHSLFIGIARASAIPSLFEIGFSIPTGMAEGEITGYHCWAQFEDPASGWVPADISEAWKNPALRDYYFGRLTPDRLVLSRGRDLTLAPKQQGPPVNFLVYPYAEIDGEPHDGVAKKFSFRER